MPLVKEINAEPLPGYRLLAPLGCGGFGEVWKCEVPGGICKAIKFVYGNLNSFDGDSVRAEDELRAIQRIKGLRHPFLLSIERVENVQGELVIVTELADSNLQEVLDLYRQAGQQGVPRSELLGYLLEAAEVLDLMNQRHDLQHLDIKPANLFLVSQHVKIGDFGLVNSLLESQRFPLGAITPLYAAPELFQGGFTQHSDQYSLAIVFQELLTGSLPFAGKNSRQLLFQHTTEEPDLRSLSDSDRQVVARALAKDPLQRFPSCLEFVESLVENSLAGGVSVPLSSPSASGRFRLHSLGETANQLGQETEVFSQPEGPPVPSDILPQYQFDHCLGSNRLLDVWQVKAPDGRQRLLKLLYGFGQPGLQERAEALARLQSLLHPALTPLEVVQVDSGRLAILSDLVEETLLHRVQECHAAQLPGIPKGELLGYLRTAAEALDYLFQQHSIQHLDLNPRSLVLRDGHLQIADFGLAQLLWWPAGQLVAAENARYAAPELFAHVVSHSSDQFSLAVIYYELLTGQHPFHGGGHQRSQPDLSRLAEAEQPVLARALEQDPHRRWSSCLDLVRALEGVPPDLENNSVAPPDRFETMLQKADHHTVPLPAYVNAADLNRLVHDLLASVSQKEAPSAPLPTMALAQGEAPLQHSFTVGLPLGSARLKLEAFAQQWYAQLIHEDEQGCVFHLDMPSNFWRHLLGRQPRLEMRVRLTRVHALSTTPIEVAAQVQPYRCASKQGRRLLQEMGPRLLDSLHTYLHGSAEKRLQERLLWPHQLFVLPLHQDGKAGEPIECRGKDISASGIGFYVPRALTTTEVLIQLPNVVGPPSLSVPATLVRAKPAADGWYEVGALFRLPAPVPSNKAVLAQS